MKNASNMALAKVGAAAIIATVCCVSIFLIFCYPRIQVKKAVGEMAQAFEAEDVNKLIGYCSNDYKDSAGLVKADIEDFLAFYFEDKENIKVSISKITVIKAKGKTIANVWGKISYATREGEKEVEFKESPLMLYFQKEEGRWKVREVSGAEPMVE
jgi:hypothetical protein